MNDELKTFSRWLGLFAGYLVVVPMATIGGVHFIYHRSAPAAVVFACFFGLFLLAWIYLIVAARRLHRARMDRARRRFRSTKQAEVRKSPWGEQRTSEPSPYSDRLASFLSTAPNGDSNSGRTKDNCIQPQQKHVSSMSFWSIVEIPRAVEPPKPLWYLRRLLKRIQDAIRN